MAGYSMFTSMCACLFSALVFAMQLFGCSRKMMFMLLVVNSCFRNYNCVWLILVLMGSGSSDCSCIGRL